MVNKERIWDLMEEVFDPEVPVLTIMDLGIVRDVVQIDDYWKISITPTYSGCPAMKTIEDDIIEKLGEYGIENVSVELVLSPAWTTQWMTDKGRNQLRDYGIAPPNDVIGDIKELGADTQVMCPHCKSANTQLVSEFSSTACKALFKCNSCYEPFDLFKHI